MLKCTSARVDITTLDNPGWRVRIPLAGTSLDHAAFPEVRDLVPEVAWMHCQVTQGRFEGAGGPLMLGRILRTFLDGARHADRQGTGAATG
ncbi:MAG TPA: Imm53 family immunity protein [Gemmatimonadaceae bacterium]